MKTKTMKTIKIQDKSYPVAFTLFFTSEFEADSGITLAEVEALPESKGSKAMLKMTYWALVDGSRVEKKQFPYDYYSLVDEIEKDSSIIEQFTEILTKKAEEKKEEATSKK